MPIKIRYIEGECFEATNEDFLLRAGSCGDRTRIESSISPGKLFLASLGMCVGTYIVRFCRRHEINHQDLLIELEYEDSNQPPKVDRIDIGIDLEVSEKYRSALIRIAKKCYIGNSLKGDVEMNYSLRD